MNTLSSTRISVDYRDRTTGKLLYTQQEDRLDVIGALPGLPKTPADGKATVYLEPTKYETRDAAGKVVRSDVVWANSPGSGLAAAGWNQARNTDRFIPADSPLKQPNLGLPTH